MSSAIMTPSEKSLWIFFLGREKGILSTMSYTSCSSYYCIQIIITQQPHQPTHLSSFLSHHTLQLFEMQKGKDNKEKEKGKASQQTQPQQQTKPLSQAQGPQSNNKEENMSPEKVVKVEEVGISGFIEEKLQVHIQEGLKEIVHFRPEDPIKYLGEFLLKRSEKFK